MLIGFRYSVLIVPSALEKKNPFVQSVTNFVFSLIFKFWRLKDESGYGSFAMIQKKYAPAMPLLFLYANLFLLSSQTLGCKV